MRMQDARYRMQDTGCKILLILLVFCYSLFTIHCSLSYAESLSDIKLDALHEPSLFLSFSHLFLGLSDIKLDALDKPIKEKWGRDPFIRYEDKIAKLKGKTFREDMPVGLKITGIISDGKKAVAIINGGFYRKNERVSNFLIVDIAKDRVSLEKNGKKFYLGVEKFAMDTRRDSAMDDNKVKDKKDDKGKDKKEDKEAKE